MSAGIQSFLTISGMRSSSRNFFAYRDQCLGGIVGAVKDLLGYLALTAHYLGDAKNEALRNAADNTILTTFYGGEKNRFNWTCYVTVHKQCHNDLEVTGTAMPEDDKVRRLLMGIHTPSLQTAVLFVRSSPALRNNFDAAVDSITTVVETLKDTTKRPFSQVSSATVNDDDHPTDQQDDRTATGGRGSQGGRGHQGDRGYQRRGGRGRGRGRGYQGNKPRGEPWTEPISSRWYQGHELVRMSEAQRQQMRDLRKGRHIGAANTPVYGGQMPYYHHPHTGHNPYHHQQAYPPPPPASMGQLPPPPPPPPTERQIGAAHQHYDGNHYHPAINRFSDSGPHVQGFARGPPRF
jgi:hypothetical protein